MKKRIFVFLACFIMIISFLPISASADMGPKPSVIISFQHMGDELCYGTLLSESEHFGPYSVWDGDEEHIYNEDLNIDIWRKFAEYKDKDGFVFLQIGWEVSDTHEISWTYYPPSVFKILLYYPDTDTFVISDIYERYAFDSYYTVDMNGVDIGHAEKDTSEYDSEKTENGGAMIQHNVNASIVATHSYDYEKEIESLIFRIIVTIIIEILLALIFGFKGKKELVLLIGVNSATQIILNVLLNIINYNSGEYALIFSYILFEIIVFAIEAVIYSVFMRKMSDEPRRIRIYIIYALIANITSFILGMYIISFMVPIMF